MVTQYIAFVPHVELYGQTISRVMQITGVHTTCIIHALFPNNATNWLNLGPINTLERLYLVENCSW